MGRPETNSPTELEGRKGGERSREGSNVICVITTNDRFGPGCEDVTFGSKVTKIRTCLLFLLGEGATGGAGICGQCVEYSGVPRLEASLLQQGEVPITSENHSS